MYTYFLWFIYFHYSTKITLVCNKSLTIFCQLSEELLAYQDFIAQNTEGKVQELFLQHVFIVLVSLIGSVIQFTIFYKE